MNFEEENIQWMFNQFNEDFGNKGNLNLLVGVETMYSEEGKDGYDMVIYDVSDLDVHLVNATELRMHCFENNLFEDEFEIRRVSISKIR